MKSFFTTATYLLLSISSLSNVLANEDNPPAECLLEAPIETIDPNQVTVTYSFTAADAATLDTLRNELQLMLQDIQEQEPGTLEAVAYVDDTLNAFHIRETFVDANAFGFHFTNTVAPKFAFLTQLATPSTFFILGSVPLEYQQAMAAAGIPAEFATLDDGLERPLLCCPIDDPDQVPQFRFLDAIADEQCDPTDNVRQLAPLSEAVTVFYKWVPKEDGNLAQVKLIHDTILATMEEEEPDALSVRFFDGEDGTSFFVRNDFRDIDAALFHLTNTAVTQFPDLAQIADAAFVSLQLAGNDADLDTYRTEAHSLDLVFVSGTFDFGFARPQPCCPDVEADGGDQESAATIVAMPWMSVVALVGVLASVSFVSE